jgi:hypothetical protein
MQHDCAVLLHEKVEAVSAPPTPRYCEPADRHICGPHSLRRYLDSPILAVADVRAKPDILPATKLIEASDSVAVAILRSIGNKLPFPLELWQQESHFRIGGLLLGVDSRQYGVNVHDLTSANLLNSAAISWSRPLDAC